MRITSKIASAGERWSVSFPTVDGEACFPFIDGNRTAQPDECLKELQRLERDGKILGVDHKHTLENCVVCQWMKIMNDWKAENCISPSENKYSKTLVRMSRKRETERVSYARADWSTRYAADGTPILRLTITTNDNGLVERKRWERMWAMKMAEAAKNIGDDISKGGCAKIELCGECDSLLDELEAFREESRRKEELRKANENRLVCDNYRNGYCTPANPKCRFYSCGKCVEVTD